MKDLKRVFFRKRLRILAILVKALSLLPAFLQMCFTCLSNLNVLSNVFYHVYQILQQQVS